MAKKTSVRRQEEIYAAYLQIQSYVEVARQFRMPETTVFAICKRLGGDALAEKRVAMREMLADEMWDKVRDLVRVVTPGSLGTERSSQGFEAAKALESIGKIAHLLEPKDKDAEAPPTEIHIHGNIQAPVQAQPSPVGPETTTT